jgi:RNA 2',3'-cyclic 3'-phosphodiesterase
VRLFTAIDIPDGVRENLQALIDHLRPSAGINWSRVDNLHITTKFVGEWPEVKLDQMKQALAAVKPAGAVEIAIRGIGWFPDARNPRVLWAGVEGGEKLAQLASVTEAALCELGVEKDDRVYSPHLTLARIRERVPVEKLRGAIGALPCTDFGSFRAAAFYLYLSAGGRYTRLAEFSCE